MAITTKPPTMCPQCAKSLIWMAPTPPEVYLGVCLACLIEYFGTASGQTGSRERVRHLSAAEHAAEQERDEEADRWD